MIIVHETFVCKPGNASKAAKMFKEAMGGDPHLRSIMTDVTGQYHRVVVVFEYDSLAAFETSMKEMENPTPEAKARMEKMKGFQEMYISGGREIYRRW